MISWTSSSPTRAAGLATSIIEVDTVTVKAVGITPEGTELSALTILEVTDVIITSRQVIPPLETTTKGLTKDFTATALMSDDTNVVVTNNTAVSWKTSNTDIASITSSQVMQVQSSFPLLTNKQPMIAA